MLGDLIVVHGKSLEDLEVAGMGTIALTLQLHGPSLFSSVVTLSLPGFVVKYFC